MNIISIETVTSEIIETDAEEWPTYRRSGSESWEQLMGESWETVYTQEKKMEQLYQKYRKSTKE